MNRSSSAIASLLAVTALLLSGCGESSSRSVASPTPSPMAATETPVSTRAAPGSAPTVQQEAIATLAVASKSPETSYDSTDRPAGWSEMSHGKDADPDYSVVFPQDRVNRITITIDAENWAAMQANMVELFGESGGGSGQAGPAGRALQGGQAPSAETTPDPETVPAPGPGGQRGAPMGQRPGGQPGGAGRAGGNLDMTPENPMWVPATISFNGETWTNVGVRYKGNSTLTTAWRQGSDKLPWKLDFDQFEDEYPEIENQRFYGFKQIALGNNSHDASYLHDALAYDILEDAGLAASKTAFYEVLLDTGNGPVSLGLYTMVEVVDDTVIERAFGSDDGNIYEADGSAASLAAGTSGRIQASFQKENNEKDADWSDIEGLYAVMHSEQRMSAPAAWRSNLEAVFDVNTFLRWLAVNTVIQDWDTYGAMSHNFYLYHDPETDQLKWISWDHNEAFSSRGRGNNSLDKEDVDENWPLIRFLLDDPIYHAQYIDALQATIEGPFDVAKVTERIDAMTELLTPYFEAENNAQSFGVAVTQLKTFVTESEAAIAAFLAERQ